MNDYRQNHGDYQPPTRAEKVAEQLRHWGHRLSLIPIIGQFTWPISTGMAATAALVDSADGFINKSFGSGLKSAISGTLDTAVTAVQSSIWWQQVSWLTTLATGDSIAELGHKGTKGLLDKAFPNKPHLTPETIAARQMQVLGPQPITAGHVPAQIAYVPGVQQQQQMAATGHVSPTGQQVPANFWADKEAQRRGQEPAAARQAWANGNHEEVAALRAANEQRAELGTS